MPMPQNEEAMLQVGFDDFMGYSNEAMDRIPPNLAELEDYRNVAFARGSSTYQTIDNPNQKRILLERYQELVVVIAQTAQAGALAPTGQQR